MISFRSRRGAFAIFAFVLLLLFLVRPGAGSLKARIARSVGRSLGKQVEIGAVSLRFLPPGFELANLVVHDDPEFGNEPIMRAPEVTASIRLLSLLRGRLDVARLELSNPSLNLVRSSTGVWNLSKLLERSAETVVAPTGKSRRESRPAFPYIQAEHARINLKSGQEKRPLAFTEAEFALWQDSEDSWGVRLKAQPMRTDSSLTDTGTVHLEGTWQRATSLRETPVQLKLDWEGAQLGQISKLLYGQDQGWRGTLNFSSTLAGKPSQMMLNTSLSVEDFRRYDVSTTEPFTLRATCQAQYSAASRLISDIDCSAPIKEGQVKLVGRWSASRQPRDYELTVSAGRVPAASVLALLRHSLPSFPGDLLATGLLTGELRVTADAAGQPILQGAGAVKEIKLTSSTGTRLLAANDLPLQVSTEPQPSRASRKEAAIASPGQAQVEIGPVTLGGDPRGAMLVGRLNRTGYSFSIAGDSAVTDLADTAKIFGVAAPAIAFKGTAKSNLLVAGNWGEKERLTGTVQLHDVRFELRGLNAPLEISDANIAIQPEQILVSNLAAVAARSTWRGSLELPRPPCERGQCSARFDLHSSHASIQDLNAYLSPAQRPRAWYDIFPGGTSGSSPLAGLRAKGRLTVESLDVHGVVASHVTSDAELEHGKLSLTNVRATLMGGRHAGEWTADFSARPPEYSGEGKLERVSLDKLSGQMQENWISGTSDASYRLHMAGYSYSDLIQSAKASLKVTARQGVLRHISLPDETEPVTMEQFTAELSLRKEQIEVKDGQLETSNGSYDVSGTATLARQLDLRFDQARQSFRVVGPLDDPKVAAVPAQAALKR